ncbi:MAG: glycosyltransferase family 2 protein [Vicinamibacterales bacterium]
MPADAVPARLVTILLPCRDEKAYIQACLASIRQWELAGWDLEVLVLDGMSTDGTRDLVAEAARLDPRIRLVDNVRRDKPSALNLGVGLARGRYVMRLDAHATYPADYLARCLEVAEATGADNVGGVLDARVHDTSWQAAVVQALTTHRFGVGGSAFRTDAAAPRPVDTVPFGFFPATTFLRFGGFDERLIHSQDYEFNRRITRGGGQIWLDPRIRVSYFNQHRLWPFYRKVLFRDGPWNPWMWYVAPYAFRWRHAVPLVFVVAVLIAPFAVAHPLGRAIVLAVAAAYAVAAIVAAAQQARRFGRWWLVAALPPAFLAYHVSYGLGSLAASLALAVGLAPVQRTATPAAGGSR